MKRQDLVGITEEHRAQRRERGGAAAVTLKNAPADFLFQALDLQAYGGLGAIEKLCSGRKSTRLLNDEECPEKIDVEIMHKLSLLQIVMIFRLIINLQSWAGKLLLAVGEGRYCRFIRIACRFLRR